MNRLRKTEGDRKQGMRQTIAVFLFMLAFGGLIGCHSHEDRRRLHANYTLMPQQAAQDLRPFYGVSTTIQGSWDPSDKDLTNVEAHLGEVSQLISEDGIRGARIARPQDYRRQYFAILVKGRKLILVNAFDIEPPPPDWREKLPLIGDGGKIEWRALFDPQTGNFSHLSTNGVG